MQTNAIGAGTLTFPDTKKTYTDKLTTAKTAATDVVKGSSAAGFADGVNTSTASKLETDSADGTEDRFLKLLVAQMRNQDPLNPMDNAAVTSQLAQISTVRGIETLNKTMTDFTTTNTQGAALSSVGMLGKQVLVPGEQFAYKPPAAGATTRVGFELDAAATAARVDLVDANGKVVFSKTMNSLQKGMQTVEWDGKNLSGGTVAAGTLSAQVIAVDGTTQVGAKALVPARVIGVSQSTDGAKLELDGAGPVAPSEVRVFL